MILPAAAPGQVVIRERMELRGEQDGRFKTAVTPEPFEKPHFFMGNGGDVTLGFSVFQRYYLGNWVLHDLNLGRIADAGAIYSYTLGEFPQWSGFSFYLVNKNDGRVAFMKSNSYSPCNFAYTLFREPSAYLVVFEPVYTRGRTITPQMTLAVDSDSTLAARPSRRVMDCLERNPFEPGGGLAFEEDRWIYYRIVGGRNTARYRLYLEKPYETLLLDDAGRKAGHYARIGKVSAGDSLRFFINSSHPVVAGEKLYGRANPLSDKYYPYRVRFEDWTDLDFADFYVDVGMGPMPNEPNSIVTEQLPRTTIFGDTAYVFFEGRRRDGRHSAFPPGQRFDVQIDEEDLGWGTLASRDGRRQGDELNNVREPVLFISRSTDELGFVPRSAYPRLHVQTRLQAPWPEVTIEGRGDVRLRPQALKVGFSVNPVAPGDTTVVIPYFEYRDGERQYFPADHRFISAIIWKGREYGHLVSADGVDLGDVASKPRPGFRFVAEKEIPQDSAVVWVYIYTTITFDRPFDPAALTAAGSGTATFSTMQLSTPPPGNNVNVPTFDPEPDSTYFNRLIATLEARGDDDLVPYIRPQIPGAGAGIAEPAPRLNSAPGTTATRSEEGETWYVVSHGRLEIGGEPLELTLEIPEPDSIWPTLRRADGGNPGNRNLVEGILIEVKRGEEMVSGQSVFVIPERIEGSGGHDHEINGEALDADSMGVFRWDGTNHEGELTASSDQQGEIEFDYQSPVFSGVMVFTAGTVVDGDTISVRDTLIVRVPDLEELGQNESTYVLSGGTCDHYGPREDELYSECRSPDNNHFIDEVARDSLISAAEYFLSAPWNRNKIMIGINDISLPLGGYFDISGNWRGDHMSHRTGLDVDIENLQYTEELRAAFEDRGWDYLDESYTSNNRYPHFRFSEN